MTLAQILVTAGGATAIAAIAWFFWGPRGEGVRAGVTSSGLQEAMILVKGSYRPDVIVVEAGKPVRLTFRREESTTCSEMVEFPDFGRSTQLPQGESVAIDLLPEQAGEYPFSCQMGMYRGRLVAR